MNVFQTYRKLLILLILAVIIVPISLFAQTDFTIIVTFETSPTTATVVKAPLKYNKDFAFSMQIDDGHESIYTMAYPFFMGGTIGSQTYPGLTYTDGCGNDINFKMSTAQYSFNGDSENGPDTHEPGTGYGQVTWPQMDSLYKNGWGVYNHGVNGNAENSNDFMSYSIKRNESYTRRKLYTTTEGGVRTRVHVNPNGQTPWSQVAFDLKYLGVLNQDNASSFMGNKGGNVNSSSVDWSQSQTLFRLHNSAVNLSSYTQGLADSSVNGSNYWGVIFTHSIGGEYPTGAFISDFDILESNYGSSGSDNILMATDEEILNYLVIRESLSISSVLVGSSLFITLNGDIPRDLRYYASTLVINSDKNITNITVTGADSFDHSPYGNTDGLINLYWEGKYIVPPLVLADSFTTIATTSNQQRDAWIAMDYIITMENGTHKDSLRNVLCGLPGLVFDDGFCIDCDIDLGVDTSLCYGNCDSILAPDGFDTYEWIVADTVYSNAQDIFICPEATTQFILHAENEFCFAIDTLIVNIAPSPQFELANDTTLCLNDSLTIYGPDTTGLDYTFQWIVADTLYDTTQNITVSPIDTTQYFLFLENESGCISYDSIWVNIIQLPIAEIIEGDTLYSCLGDSADFTVEGTGVESYLWSTGDTTQSIRVSPEIADSTYTYIVDIFNSYGCSVSDTVKLVVFNTPEFELANDTTFCFGDSLTIYGPDTTGLNYVFAWIVADTLYDTTQNITVSPIDTTQYFLFVENESGCTTYDSIWVNILAIPIAEIIQSDTVNICFGDSSEFIVEGTGIEGYLWSNGDTTQSIKVSPNNIDSTYKYSVDIFNNYGCSISDTVWLIYNPMPEIAMSFDTIRKCYGDEFIVSVITNPPWFVDKYIWYYEDNIDTIAVPYVRFFPTISSTVYLEILTPEGCTLWDSTFIELNETPILEVIEDQLICGGEPLSLYATGADFYYWILNNDTISTESIVDIIAEETVQYYVIGKNQSGCEIMDSVTINVLTAPITEILYDGSNPACQTSLITLTASGADNYWWSTDETTEEISFEMQEEVLIELFGTSDNGCSSSDSLRLLVRLADPVYFSGLLPAYCENDLASTLYGEPSGGIFTGSGVVGDEFRPSLAGVGQHIITYTYTTADNCVGFDDDTTTVYGSGLEIDLGEDQIINPTETIVLDASNGFDNYYWSTGSTYRNIIINYGDNPVGSVVKYVVIGVINGCTSQGEVNIIFANPFGIGENNVSRFSLFPNPNKGTSTVSYLEEVKEFRVFVYDNFGKLIFHEFIECNPDCKSEIELPELSNGLYIVKTLSKKGVSSRKLIIQ